MKKDITNQLQEASATQEDLFQQAHRLEAFKISSAFKERGQPRLRFIATNGAAASASSIPCACRHTPVFTSRDVTNLRVTEPSDYENRLHYIAISYCWKHDKTDEDERHYWMRTGRRERFNHAPARVLDRAINVAVTSCTRFIWIDQECIHQDDRLDKELGIQSMDLVYQRAKHAVALLNVRLNFQWEVNVLQKAFEFFEIFSPAELVQALDVLEMIAGDRWFERAWCFQEAIAAGDSMVLLIQCSSDLDLDQFPGSYNTSGEFTFTAMNLINGVTRVLEECVTQEVHTEVQSRAEAVFNTVWDKFLKSSNSGRRDPEFQYACYAAQALKMLAVRKNSRVHDLLAILANLCNYSVRMNTALLADFENGYGEELSLSVCALTLSLWNGDFSLLVGENVICTEKQLQIDRTVVKRPISWLPLCNITVANVPYFDEYQGRHLFSECTIDGKGLSFKGLLWKVDYALDLSALRDQIIQVEDMSHKQLIVLQRLMELGLVDLANALWVSGRSFSPTKSFTMPSHVTEVIQQDTNEFLLSQYPYVEHPVRQFFGTSFFGMDH